MHRHKLTGSHKGPLGGSKLHVVRLDRTSATKTDCSHRISASRPLTLASLSHSKDATGHKGKS